MLEKIVELLKEYKGDDTLTITADTTFEELALDSLDTVELVMNMEDSFNVSIEMNESIKTVGDLLQVIENAK